MMRFGAEHAERAYAVAGSSLSSGTQFTHIMTPSGEKMLMCVSSRGVST